MQLRTLGRDCLILNWVVPIAGLPPAPAGLEYAVASSAGADRVLASLALFRQRILQLPGVSIPKVSFPQLTVRVCVLDAEGVASFFVPALKVPAWVLPTMKLVAPRSARMATFDVPPSGSMPGDEPLRWRVRGRGALEVAVCAGARWDPVEPDLGGFEGVVRYVQRRRRWYLPASEGVRRLEIEATASRPLPLRAEVREAGLVAATLELTDEPAGPELHSAWYVPEVPFVLTTGRESKGVLPESLPAPG